MKLLVIAYLHRLDKGFFVLVGQFDILNSVLFLVVVFQIFISFRFHERRYDAALSGWRLRSCSLLSIHDDDSFFTEEGFSEYSIVDWNESIKMLTQTDKDILYLE